MSQMIQLNKSSKAIALFIAVSMVFTMGIPLGWGDTLFDNGELSANSTFGAPYDENRLSPEPEGNASPGNDTTGFMMNDGGTTSTEGVGTDVLGQTRGIGELPVATAELVLSLDAPSIQAVDENGSDLMVDFTGSPNTKRYKIEITSADDPYFENVLYSDDSVTWTPFTIPLADFLTSGVSEYRIRIKAISDSNDMESSWSGAEIFEVETPDVPQSGGIDTGTGAEKPEMTTSTEEYDDNGDGITDRWVTYKVEGAREAKIEEFDDTGDGIPDRWVTSHPRANGTWVVVSEGEYVLIGTTGTPTGAVTEAGPGLGTGTGTGKPETTSETKEYDDDGDGIPDRWVTIRKEGDQQTMIEEFDDTGDGIADRFKTYRFDSLLGWVLISEGEYEQPDIIVLPSVSVVPVIESIDVDEEGDTIEIRYDHAGATYYDIYIASGSDGDFSEYFRVYSEESPAVVRIGEIIESLGLGTGEFQVRMKAVQHGWAYDMESDWSDVATFEVGVQEKQPIFPGWAIVPTIQDIDVDTADNTIEIRYDHPGATVYRIQIASGSDGDFSEYYLVHSQESPAVVSIDEIIESLGLGTGEFQVRMQAVQHGWAFDMESDWSAIVTFEVPEDAQPVDSDMKQTTVDEAISAAVIENFAGKGEDISSIRIESVESFYSGLLDNTSHYYVIVSIGDQKWKCEVVWPWAVSLGYPTHPGVRSVDLLIETGSGTGTGTGTEKTETTSETKEYDDDGDGVIDRWVTIRVEGDHEVMIEEFDDNGDGILDRFKTYERFKIDQREDDLVGWVLISEGEYAQPETPTGTSLDQEIKDTVGPDLQMRGEDIENLEVISVDLLETTCTDDIPSSYCRAQYHVLLETPMWRYEYEVVIHSGAQTERRLEATFLNKTPTAQNDVANVVIDDLVKKGYEESSIKIESIELIPQDLPPGMLTGVFNYEVIASVGEQSWRYKVNWAGHAWITSVEEIEKDTGTGTGKPETTSETKEYDDDGDGIPDRWVTIRKEGDSQTMIEEFDENGDGIPDRWVTSQREGDGDWVVISEGDYAQPDVPQPPGGDDYSQQTVRDVSHEFNAVGSQLIINYRLPIGGAASVHLKLEKLVDGEWVVIDEGHISSMSMEQTDGSYTFTREFMDGVGSGEYRYSIYTVNSSGQTSGIYESGEFNIKLGHNVRGGWDVSGHNYVVTFYLIDDTTDYWVLVTDKPITEDGTYLTVYEEKIEDLSIGKISIPLSAFPQDGEYYVYIVSGNSADRVMGNHGYSDTLTVTVNKTFGDSRPDIMRTRYVENDTKIEIVFYEVKGATGYKAKVCDRAGTCVTFDVAADSYYTYPVHRYDPTHPDTNAQGNYIDTMVEERLIQYLIAVSELNGLAGDDYTIEVWAIQGDEESSSDTTTLNAPPMSPSSDASALSVSSEGGYEQPNTLTSADIRIESGTETDDLETNKVNVAFDDDGDGYADRVATLQAIF